MTVLYENKENCCGCGACYSACPAQAITMQPDKEGFLYPVVDEEKCIHCNRCIGVCAFKKDQIEKGLIVDLQSTVPVPETTNNDYEKPLCYAVKHKNLDVRMASRSGGVFTALSDQVLKNSGVVYGCVLTEQFDAVHFRAESFAHRNQMRGSKYIQSKLLETYRQAKEDLEASREVLFSGTSCQIAGLRSFLKKDYENLLCVDIVCHGVPSSVVWHAFLDWQRKRSDSEIAAVDFRNKVNFGWESHVESVYLANGNRSDSEVFKNLFYGHNVLRESCYKCPYKSTKHPGDITIADYWGIDKATPNFNDNKGVSLVLVNNERGNKLLQNVLHELEFRQTKLEDSLQPPLIKSFERPKERNQFWSDFEKLEFDRIAKKYGGYGMANKLKRILKKIKRKIKRIVLKLKISN